MPPGMAETAGAALARCEVFNDFKLRPHHWNKNQLGDALADRDSERRMTTILA